MFMKEIENADESCWSRWLLCWCKSKEKGEDPKKLSTFVEDVMDPYGRQDKYVREVKAAEDTARADKSRTDAAFIKKIFAEIQQTNTLLKNNILCTGQIYSMMEEGRTPTPIREQTPLSLKKHNVVRLFGPEAASQNNIHISFEDELESTHISDNAEIKSVRSDSSDSLVDIDVMSISI